MAKDNTKLAKKLDEIVRPYCQSEWCLLKEILKHKSSFGLYFFCQMKCIEKSKFEKSEKAGKDIGWDIATSEWVENGYAAAFAKYYDEDLTAEQIYEKIIKACKK